MSLPSTSQPCFGAAEKKKGGVFFFPSPPLFAGALRQYAHLSYLIHPLSLPSSFPSFTEGKNKVPSYPPLDEYIVFSTRVSPTSRNRWSSEHSTATSGRLCVLRGTQHLLRSKASPKEGEKKKVVWCVFFWVTVLLCCLSVFLSSPHSLRILPPSVLPVVVHSSLSQRSSVFFVACAWSTCLSLSPQKKEKKETGGLKCTRAASARLFVFLFQFSCNAFKASNTRGGGKTRLFSMCFTPLTLPPSPQRRTSLCQHTTNPRILFSLRCQ